ncbi:hypothetical protein [Planococcus sp. CAU13]|uniref:hypothetical protein n=1 Tax=Planococcus sp. CAU13 TaxID=1541197 RepID=UPI00052FE699|nr:hypothetical protein [Planococcus sp. CAU13]
MSEIDKKGRLDEEPFTYQLAKSGTVLIAYEGKTVVILKGKEAERLSGKLSVAAGDVKQEQLLLAKATGNFKRGNERMGKSKGK